MKHLFTLTMVIGFVALTGCSSNYVAPGPGVRMDQITQQGVAGQGWTVERPQPTATFPARVAVARVQGSGYCNYNLTAYGSGRYSVVTTREVESDEDLAKLSSLPQLAGLAMLNRMVLPSELNSDRELRQAASKLQADLLLIYSFDTSFRVNEHEIGPLGVISLGMIPNHEARVTSTCSAMLLDVNTGYIYGLADATGKQSELASYWRSEEAVDSARVKAEQKAFAALVPELQKMWTGVVKGYAGSVKD